MKLPYNKPTVIVEELILDQPIAANCKANFDDVKSLINLGYFNGDMDYCSINFDSDIEWGNDTVCYHSNVQTALLS